MQNSELILSTLEDIDFSLNLILKRSQHILSVDDFLKDDSGLEKLDSISMRLVAIGEAFKNIDKLSNNTILKNYPQIPWKQVKGIRDILSHHYFDIDAEIIFDVSKDEVPKLLDIVKKMIKDLSKT
ncbi:MAG: antitoxin [Arcobacter sp.]|nr:MAG: antitoxin [Arcobacter sp.]